MGYHGFYGWESGQQGIAFIGGVCTIDKMGLGEDKADTFSGVRITAHELGHMLGCPHDGQQYTHFSSKNCPWSDGFMMTSLSNSSRSMKFSTCCNKAISELARSPQGDCLETMNATRRINKKHDTDDLPGDVLTRDDVCRLAFPEAEDIRFVTDNSTARCYADCYSPSLNKTLRTILPDNSRCNETSIEGIQSRQMVCVNGDCRTIRNKYPVEPVKPTRQ
ncbi:metalloprotease mig-17-like [Dermacentor silvarum]|uniref:metalloprotease mig-17-like n=1 Tax=Dermacentor silvarum TaxID=543639 RepID=UPI00210166C3|nr:metalloprotease mig-17-like [Dermacentor silvarum]